MAILSSSISRRLPSADFSAGDRAGNAAAGVRLKIIDACQLEAAVLARRHDRRGQRMFAAAFQAGRQTENLVFVLISPDWNDRNKPRLAFGERAGFVDDQRVDFLQAVRATRHS